MSAFPGSPRTLSGGIVALEPLTGVLLRTIALQYNPDTVTRTLQVQAAGQASGDRLDALRLKGPPAETISLEAELDATDDLEHPDEHPQTAATGLHGTLAALETLVYPSAARLIVNGIMAQAGVIEVLPAEAPLTVFVWSRQRVVPVRITELTVTEEAFDPALNPIRAKVRLGMHVLSVSDLPFLHRGTALYLAHQLRKERLAATAAGGSLSALGHAGTP
jgi:hypothetical protein